MQIEFGLSYQLLGEVLSTPTAIAAGRKICIDDNSID
jgi:hypothetical protein